MQEEVVEWKRALAEQTAEVQQGVNQRMAKVTARHNSTGRRIRKSPPVLKFTRNAKSLLNGRLLRREDWRFDHIMQYLEHEALKS
ncbi:MAG: hypothetical protein ACI9F9_000476 [Candidatus Paceibacteria bacterium]|jgi:hypothetical protein